MQFLTIYMIWVLNLIQLSKRKRGIERSTNLKQVMVSTKIRVGMSKLRLSLSGPSASVLEGWYSEQMGFCASDAGSIPARYCSYRTLRALGVYNRKASLFTFDHGLFLL